MGRTRIAAALLAVALAVAACGDDDDGSSPATVPADETSSTPTSERETTTTTDDPTAAVEQAFYDQWDAFVAILSKPDPDNPLIDKHFTGEARESLLDSVGSFIAEGKIAQPPERQEDFDPRIVETQLESESVAVVFECTIDGTRVVDAASGEVLDDDVETYEARNVFELKDGSWKLSSSGEIRDGDPSCDEL